MSETRLEAGREQPEHGRAVGLVWKSGDGEQHVTEIEHAWRHALCCILDDGGSMAWWAVAILEGHGVAA